jgi:tetratricopeptide (TPR) repeat protein
MSIQLFEESKPLAEKFDNLLDENNYEKLVACVHKLEDYVSNNEFKKEDSIFYYIGTIYSSLANFKKESENGSSEETKIEYRKQANYYFRKALELKDSDDMLLLVVHINYANNLDACGRVLEALRFYRKAIEINPVFGMAIGN